MFTIRSIFNWRHVLPILFACLGFSGLCMVGMEPIGTCSQFFISKWLIVGGYGYYHHLFNDDIHIVTNAKIANNNSSEAVVVPKIPIICHKSPNSEDDMLHFPFKLILLQTILFIIITKVVRYFLKPLCQPKVVSEVLAGIIMGPSVMGRSKRLSAIFSPMTVQFVAKNLGIMGFMLFLFLSGVKMDMSVIKTSGRKERLASLIGMLIPVVLLTGVSVSLRPVMDEELAKVSSIGAVVGLFSVSGFYVIHPILQEMNLLSSEVGRTALSVSIIVDMVGIVFMIVFEGMRHVEHNQRATMWYNVSVVVVVMLLTITVRKFVKWIIDNHPIGKPIGKVYVVGLLLGCMVVGFLSDMFGIGIANGSFWLGIVIPDGPPLGSTIVEKSEALVLNLFMPFSYILIGMLVDVFALMSTSWSSLAPLFVISVTGFVGRIVANVIASFVLEMSTKERISLSLMLSLRGQMELIVMVHWLDKGIIGIPSFTMVVLLTIASTSIVTPIIGVLYDPTRPYMISKWRTIQHHPPNTDLKILLCVNDHETLPGLLNLLDFTYPTRASPFNISALHIVEMVGRAAPIFVDHEHQRLATKYAATSYSIHACLKFYQRSKQENIATLHSFTAVAPKRTMYQDVCGLGLAQNTTLIILPFHKTFTKPMDPTTSVLSQILDHAPCSIGVLVQNGEFHNPWFLTSDPYATHPFIVIFMGGSDAREGLAYADRMVTNPYVNITVVRFLVVNNRGEDEMETKLDRGVLQWFMARNEATGRVTYKEIEVSNGEETMAAINALKSVMNYELWILGRERGINHVLLEGLSWWNNHQELGVIGDYVSSSDFGIESSVLVVQQQVLRENVSKYRRFSNSFCYSGNNFALKSQPR